MKAPEEQQNGIEWIESEKKTCGSHGAVWCRMAAEGTHNKHLSVLDCEAGASEEVAELDSQLAEIRTGFADSK